MPRSQDIHPVLISTVPVFCVFYFIYVSYIHTIVLSRIFPMAAHEARQNVSENGGSALISVNDIRSSSLGSVVHLCSENVHL